MLHYSYIDACVGNLCLFDRFSSKYISILIWANRVALGLIIIADSGQSAAAGTELSAPKLVGTALTVQMATGFGITMITSWLVPVFAQLFGGFQWMFLLLAPGPFIGAIAMLLLRRHPHSGKLASGKR